MKPPSWHKLSDRIVGIINTILMMPKQSSPNKTLPNDFFIISSISQLIRWIHADSFVISTDLLPANKERTEKELKKQLIVTIWQLTLEGNPSVVEVAKCLRIVNRLIRATFIN